MNLEQRTEIANQINNKKVEGPFQIKRQPVDPTVVIDGQYQSEVLAILNQNPTKFHVKFSGTKRKGYTATVNGFELCDLIKYGYRTAQFHDKFGRSIDPDDFEYGVFENRLNLNYFRQIVTL